jgi:hypothetical protein
MEKIWHHAFYNELSVAKSTPSLPKLLSIRKSTARTWARSSSTPSTPQDHIQYLVKNLMESGYPFTTSAEREIVREVALRCVVFWSGTANCGYVLALEKSYERQVIWLIASGKCPVSGSIFNMLMLGLYVLASVHLRPSSSLRCLDTRNPVFTRLGKLSFPITFISRVLLSAAILTWSIFMATLFFSGGTTMYPGLPTACGRRSHPSSRCVDIP